MEALDGRTPEARFVKAIDKLQALGFVTVKKRGAMLDKKLRFTLQYSEKAVAYFPENGGHYDELKGRLLARVARQRKIAVAELERTLYTGRVIFITFPRIIGGCQNRALRKIRLWQNDDCGIPCGQTRIREV